MDRVEEMIRESLTARANDVEPTPALWLEVDRRVARRKRFQVMTWSLAGATAALAGVLVVPAIIGTVTDDRPELDIGAVPQTPAGGVVPEFYVTDVDGELQIREVATGEHRPHQDATFASEYAVTDLAVRPGSTGEDYSIVATYGDSGRGAQVMLLDTMSSGEEDGVATAQSTGSFTLPEYEAAPEFVPSGVWAPDEKAVALTLPMPEADQTNVVLWETPTVPEGRAGAVPLDPDVRELGLVLGEGEVELLDWVGQTTDTGDESILYFRDDLGVHALGLTVAEDGTMTPGAQEVYDSWYDVAFSHALPSDLDPPYYGIAEEEDGPVLLWADTEIQRGDVIPLGEVFGDVDPTSLWVDAKQDAALVGDGERTFLFAHDGTGNFAPPAELEAGAVAALFDAPRPGEPAPEPDASQDPTEAPAAPDPTPDEETAHGAGGALPEPVVTATTTELVLHGPDGEQVLYTLPEEGHSTFLDVSVRPGSTIDDLTIVALHLAEGMQDFRTYRYVDGELSVEYWYDGAEDLQVGAGGAAGDAVAAFGPVWHPDGDKLAWIEMGTSGTPQLRIIGWDDGPGTGNRQDDNMMVALDELQGTVVEPVEWADHGGGRTEIYAVSEDFFNSLIKLPIEIQGDNAASWSGEVVYSALASGGEGRVGGAVGTGPRWWLQGDTIHSMENRSVTVALPDEFFPDEGLPDTWMRELGDGVLVGMSNTGLAYYVTPDGDLTEVGGGAVMDGDVVD